MKQIHSYTLGFLLSSLFYFNQIYAQVTVTIKPVVPEGAIVKDSSGTILEETE